jgi:hypothetical protein
MKDVLKEQRYIKTTELRANKGQLVERGIPKNPRKIIKEKFNLLLQSLDKSNLTQIRPLDVIEHEGKFIVLSGNQRLRALKELKVKEVPCNILRDDLEPETYRQIVLQANTNYGEHDDDLLANEWDAVELHEWGYDLPEWEDVEQYGEAFQLKDGEKEGFQQITFTLADEQAEIIKNKINEFKKTDKYKYLENYGNENSNGNALYGLLA